MNDTRVTRSPHRNPNHEAHAGEDKNEHVFHRITPEPEPPRPLSLPTLFLMERSIETVLRSHPEPPKPPPRTLKPQPSLPFSPSYSKNINAG
ncbi:hypothetical protein DY000_02025614 [Brassica cretica]|uniref:VQ domain-containing protein n=1 Tax=Brassica cretica TaxID=69181 RepID=A0ABQ7EKF2_BRACR|nr:hypothetical protein DY000_02025614 [Brassica cretica]